MKYSLITKDRSQQAIDLFRGAFAAAEAEAKGELIATTTPENLID